MIKYIIILVNTLALLLIRFFFAGDITVKMDAPAQVKQGQEFTVSITINKGSIAGVGHMKQVLPVGFTNAVVIEAKGAEFKYIPEDNVVKFTWISLPADQEFTVSYKITPDAAMQNGPVDLAGKFSYVLNNEKQTFEVTPSTITVGGETLATTTTTTPPESTATTTTPPETTATTTTPPETTATTTTPPETTATATNVSPPETTATTTTPPETTATTTTPPDNTAKVASTVTASRTIVGSPEAGMEFTVEINIKKDGLKGFARIQETLPTGLTAMSLDNKGGTFSFIDQKVKIIWDNLPADEDIKISYRVSAGDNVSGDLSITGSFSYVENDNPMKSEIPASTISVKAKTALANNNQNQNTNNTNNNTTANNNQTTNNNTNTNVTAPETKVNYKVQICALSKMDRSTSYFESKYTISGKVNMEFHEGWRKYITGKYNMYKDARDYREKVRSKGVENPFVTAYSNGKRVTVQEALMVSNQKWIP